MHVFFSCMSMNVCIIIYAVSSALQNANFRDLKMDYTDCFLDLVKKSLNVDYSHHVLNVSYSHGYTEHGLPSLCVEHRLLSLLKSSD